MGLAMANNLQRHLATKKALSLLYSNRTMSRGSPLQTLGGIPEPSFDKLVSRCGIIFTMVRITPPKSTNPTLHLSNYIPRSQTTQSSKV
jgi:3-hydroxyisobutyrate dehydrogenase-like beta-hydroxyacid dehydrogenase